MPPVTAYLKSDVYFRLLREADRLGLSIGKLVGMICEEYCRYLEHKEVENARKEIQTRSGELPY